MLNFLNIHMIAIMIYHFCLKEWQLKNAGSLYAIYMTKNYVVHLKALKQALYHGLTIKKVHRIIQFNKRTLLKTYIDMNTKLKTEAKNDFKKIYF